MSDDIIGCGINYLSYDRACGLVPREFIPAYEWFLSKEGQLISRLPRGADAPELTAPIKLASQRGMHSPNYGELPSKGDGKKKYVLSVHSAGSFRAGLSRESVAYEDADLIRHIDGTWTIEYSCQMPMADKKHTDSSNAYMMNNLNDGVPVALMTKESGGYRIHGLAYVEAFNPLTRMFTLYGPVSAEKRGVRFSSFIACDIVIFGLYLAGIISIPVLARERRADLSRLRVRSTLGALLLGIGFSFGWTPCVGPIMATILALSAETGSAVAGGFLMFVYALGMSVPFVAITLASDVLLDKVRSLQRYLPALKRAGGALIAIMGIWMIVTQFPQMAAPSADQPAASSETASVASSDALSGASPTAEDLIGTETTETEDVDASGYSTAWRNVVLADIDGTKHRFSDLKGTPVYFEFWGTWCSECVSNMDAYAAVAREHNDAGDVRVISVFTPNAYGEKDAAGIAQWLAERNADFPVWLDTNQSLGTYLKLRAFPTSVFVNSDGSIAKVRIGVIGYDELEGILASLS